MDDPYMPGASYVINTVLVLCLTTLTHVSSSSVSVMNCTYTNKGGVVVSADCSDLGWTEVPQNLPETLLALDLSRNKITKLHNRTFSYLPDLQSLDLSDNHIAHLADDAFGGLLGLTWLSLMSNDLQMIPGTFPDDVFRDLGRLVELDLRSNQPYSSRPDQVYPDAALRHLKQLRVLRLDGLASNAELGRGFSQLHNLEHFYMNDDAGFCSISNITERFFYHINTSRPLTVSLLHCKTRAIHRNAFSYLPTLHSLDLYWNHYLGFDGFREASYSLQHTKIKILNISKIHRTENIRIKREHFEYLGYTWLEHLEVNKVNAFDIDLYAMFQLPTCMRYLSLADNKFINGTFLIGVYFLPHMETLQIGKQLHFTEVPEVTDKKLHETRPPLSQTLKGEGPNFENDSTARNFAASSGTGLRKLAAGRDLKKLHTRTHPFKRDARSVLNVPHPSSSETGISKLVINRDLNQLHLPTDRFRGAVRSVSSVLQPASTEAGVSKLIVGKDLKKLHTRTRRRKRAARSVSKVAHPVSTQISSPKIGERTDLKDRRWYDPDVCNSAQGQKELNAVLFPFFNKLRSFLVEHDVRGRTKSRYSSPMPWTGGPNSPFSFVPGNNRSDVGFPVSPSLNPDLTLLPPSIKYAYAREMKLGYSLPFLHFTVNSLEVFDLSTNNIPCFIGPWLGLDKLRSFDLSDNYCVGVSKVFFSGMKNLTHLFLQGNFLGPSFAADTHGQILSGLANLEVLDLTRNYIKRLSPSAFSAQTTLKTLRLSRNAITDFHPRIGHMTALEILDLSGNSLAGLSPFNRQDIDLISASSNLTIDLRGNRLLCDCSTLDFWYWVIQQKEERLVRREEYSCTTSNGSVVDYGALSRELDSLWLRCQGPTILNITLGVFGALIFLLTVAGVIHYKRWRLLYYYYVGRRRYHPPYHWQHYVACDVKDVFISYDDMDIRIRHFLQETLLPELDRRGVTYIISEIDFLAGRPVKDVIREAVLGARKTLALFSSTFFPSDDRELEFNMAVFHEEDTMQRVIVPVLLEQVDWATFPPEVQIYLEAHPWIPFRYRNERFLDGLVQLIKTDTPST